jgi:hypothetical protein
VQGDLIDALDFSIYGAGMGQTQTMCGPLATLVITLHDPPGTNHGPADHNRPTLDHVDVIAGEVSGRIAPTDPRYTSEVNETTRVIARFDATGGIVDENGLASTAWTDLGEGWKSMSLLWNSQGRSMYFRLRGSNLGLKIDNETDGNGNPLCDRLAGNNSAIAYDDLWFYSNPIFLAPLAGPEADIRANGAETAVVISAHDRLALTVSMNSQGYAGIPVDWWLVAVTPGGWYHYGAAGGAWLPGWAVSAQGSLVDIPATLIFDGTLAPGNYLVFFGVDYPMNGTLDNNLLFFDSVVVTVGSY